MLVERTMRWFGAAAWADGTTLVEFEQVLELYREAVTGRATGAALPEGVASMVEGHLLLDSAVSRDLRTAAVRWTGELPGGWTVEEAFRLEVSESKAVIGWRRLGRKEEEGGDPEWPAWCGALLGSGPKREVVTHDPPAFPAVVAALMSSEPVQVVTGAPEDRKNMLLKAELEDLEGQLTSLHQSLREMAGERRSLKDALAKAQTGAQAGAVALQDPVFERYEDVPLWAARNEDRLVIHPRALVAVKKATYVRPRELFEVLDILAGPYRDVKLGLAGREVLDKALQSGPFILSQSGGETTMNIPEYSVRWEGKRHLLEMHMGKGGGFEPRYCLRVYFCFDEDSERVLVGHMPSHLPNSLT